jgi:NADH dehydrogenase/NADH:ubiquinone oxidoreductase subunit G
MVTLTINGKIVQAQEGEMLLAVLRREKIEIPALCHHDAVEPYGACRLCMVEITRPEWEGWTKYVTSCLYPVEDGLIVSTHSPKIIELRKTIIDLYLARHPNTPEIIKLATEYGITRTSYEVVPDGDDCILCSLCTRICDQMGFSAIAAVGRGHNREIAPPLREAPPDCTGCLACAHNCPTNFIKFSDENNIRTIWKKSFELITCSQCGKATITKEFAEHLSKNRDIPITYFEICDDCHRRETALTMGRITNWSREAQS